MKNLMSWLKNLIIRKQKNVEKYKNFNAHTVEGIKFNSIIVFLICIIIKISFGIETSNDLTIARLICIGACLLFALSFELLQKKFGGKNKSSEFFGDMISTFWTGIPISILISGLMIN